MASDGEGEEVVKLAVLLVLLELLEVLVSSSSSSSLLKRGKADDNGARLVRFRGRGDGF